MVPMLPVQTAAETEAMEVNPQRRIDLGDTILNIEYRPRIYSE